jgi:hypothetical protein
MEYNLKPKATPQPCIGDFIVFEDGRIRYLAYDDDNGYCLVNLQSGRITTNFYEEKGLLLLNITDVERVIPSSNIAINEK